MRHLSSYHRINHLAVKNELKQIEVEDEALLPKKKLHISFYEENLINGCIEIVTVNGRPFSVLDDSGFQRIVSPFFQGFAEN